MSKKPLAHWPDEKKEKLAMLIKRFNLDVEEVIVRQGPNTGHWVKNIYSGEWKVLRDKKGNLLWPKDGHKAPRNPLVIVAPTDTKPKCRFNLDEYVSFKNDPDKVRYQVKEVKSQPFGRTGFWLKLVDKYGLAAFNKLIESAELEPCPIVGEIYGSGRRETITIY